MALDLISPDGGTQRAFDDGSFVPVNGDNTFNTGLDPRFFDREPDGSINTDWFLIDIVANGPGMTGATIVSDIDIDGNITINFATDGATSANVRAQNVHTPTR